MDQHPGAMTIIKQFRTIIPIVTRPLRTTYRHYSPIFHSSTKEKSLNVTDSALNRLRVLKQKFPEKMLRIAVEAGGCHGFQYKFSLDGTTEYTETDT